MFEKRDIIIPLKLFFGKQFACFAIFDILLQSIKLQKVWLLLKFVNDENVELRKHCAQTVKIKIGII